MSRSYNQALCCDAIQNQGMEIRRNREVIPRPQSGLAQRGKIEPRHPLGTKPRLQLLYLADEQRLTYSPDERELDAFERQLHALWRAIEAALDSGDFRTSKGPLCRFCSYQSLCPEFGGAPPPYPGPPGSGAALDVDELGEVVAGVA